MAGHSPPTAFDVLAHPTRQRLVSVLHDREGRSIAVDALATELRDRTPQGFAPAASDVRLESELHHVHLPKLTDAGVLEYDHDARTVDVRDVESVYRVLASVPPTDRSAGRFD